jgi:hypothetical protein
MQTSLPRSNKLSRKNLHETTTSPPLSCGYKWTRSCDLIWPQSDLCSLHHSEIFEIQKDGLSLSHTNREKQKLQKWKVVSEFYRSVDGSARDKWVPPRAEQGNCSARDRERSRCWLEDKVKIEAGKWSHGLIYRGHFRPAKSQTKGRAIEKGRSVCDPATWPPTNGERAAYTW